MRRLLASAAAVALLVAGSPARAATNDDFSAEQWGLRKIRAEDAWTVTKGGSVVVAVVDSGVDLGHPDLQGRLVPGKDFVDGGPPADENGHGTHMAGTIAAITGNGEGIASVAPASKVMPVRVLNELGRADAETVRDGIEWAVDHGADVVNLSLAQDGPGSGGTGLLDDLLSAPPIDEGVRYATERGAVVVIAAGNDDGGGKARTPYDATVDGALVVGASTTDDRRAAYSNYGDGLDVLAPGGGSPTDPNRDTGCTRQNAVIGLYWTKSDGSTYAFACGTSVSVAVVSGIAALLLTRGLDNAAVVRRITDTATDLAPSGPDQQSGFGRVDAAAAVGARVAPRPKPRASGSATSSASPRGSVGPAGKATSKASPGRPRVVDPDSTGSPGPGAPQAAPPGSGAPGRDRGVPITVATALAVFVAWAHRLAAGSRRVEFRARE